MKSFSILIVMLSLLIASCIPKEGKDASNALQKIEIDLSMLDANGLRGPADGKVSVAYEFCIPNTNRCKAEVQAIDDSVKFYPVSRGRIEANKDQCLCIGYTRKDYRKVLLSLANLSYIKRIVECHFE